MEACQTACCLCVVRCKYWQERQECSQTHTHTHTCNYCSYSFPDFLPALADDSAFLKAIYYHYPSICLNAIIQDLKSLYIIYLIFIRK